MEQKNILKPNFCLPESKAKKIIKNSNFHFYNPSKSEVKLNIDIPDFKSINELRKYTFKSYIWVLAELSSLVSYSKDANTIIYKHRVLINEIIESGITVYEYYKKILKSKKPDLIYLFNGRFANNRAILDA